jgi:hypothetical protein
VCIRRQQGPSLNDHEQPPPPTGMALFSVDMLELLHFDVMFHGQLDLDSMIMGVFLGLNQPMLLVFSILGLWRLHACLHFVLKPCKYCYCL